MGGVGSGRYPKGYKLATNLAEVFKQRYFEATRDGHYMDCPVCSVRHHYRTFKQHMVREHGWRYFPDPNFPSPAISKRRRNK